MAPCSEDFLADPNIGRFLKHDGSSFVGPTAQGDPCSGEGNGSFLPEENGRLEHCDGLGASDNPV